MRARRSADISPLTATFSGGMMLSSGGGSSTRTTTRQKSSRPLNSVSMNARSPSPSEMLNASAQVPTVTPTRVSAVRTFCRHSPPRANLSS